jgi:predicted amidophosphoribosyltransferase
LGTYYCAKCMKGTGDKPGNCPQCQSATVQITRKYCAKMGGTPMKQGKGRKGHKEGKGDEKDEKKEDKKD